MIQRILQSYRSLYVRILVQYIDAAHWRESKPVWSALPGCAEWNHSTVLTVCRTELKVEVRQRPTVWAKVQAQQVPFRRVCGGGPVAQTACSTMPKQFSSVDSPLCGVLEDHPHVFKKCFFFKDNLALVRRLWGVHVSENAWHEPSTMCTDYTEWSVWSVVYARWLIRCEVLSDRPPDVPKAVLQQFFSIMLTWKAMPQGALPREVAQTTCHCIKDILRVRDKLQGLSRQQGTAWHGAGRWGCRVP